MGDFVFEFKVGDHIAAWIPTKAECGLNGIVTELDPKLEVYRGEFRSVHGFYTQHIPERWAVSIPTYRKLRDQHWRKNTIPEIR